jgi:dipeptidyl aminopeptidase/acylaminoacyl peptidase
MGSLPSVVPGVPAYSTRVWVLDPGARQARVTPLIPDTQMPSHNRPRWSADGKRMAVSELVAGENRDPGIRILDPATGESVFHPTTFAALGEFSPDGERFVLPRRVAVAGQVRTIIESLDLQAGTSAEVSPPDVPLEQGQLGWNPEGSTITIARRYVGQEPTLGRQLYNLEPSGAGIRPLLVDADFDHAFFVWEPKGGRLLVERSLVRGGSAQDSRSQIWILDPASNALTQVATNAFYPRWVP